MPTHDIATLGLNVDARQVKDGDRALDNFERTARRTESSTDRLNKTQERLARAMKAVAAALAVNEIAQLAAKLYEAAAAADRLNLAFKFSFGATAARELQFVRKLANDLGLEFQTTATAYGKLSAAARGTTLAGEGAKAIFVAVSKASAVMGLSADQTAGALTALEQMISKGTVSSEELKGQLGERLPGAFQIAARAMGKTTQELQKMLEQGEVLAEDFLPKFARQLEKEIGDAADKAADRLDAATNRMGDAFKRLMTAAAESGVSDFLKRLAQGAANDMNAVSEAMERAKAGGSGTLGQWNAGAGMAIGRTLGLQNFSDDFKTVNAQLATALATVSKLEAKPKLSLWEQSDLANARRRIESITAYRQAAEGAANDANAQDARLMAMGAAQQAQVKASEKAAGDLAETRRKLYGVDKDYLPTLQKLHEQFEAGKLSQREYVDLVTKLADANVKKAPKGAGDNKFEQDKKAAEEYLKSLQLETAELGKTEQQQFMLNAAKKAALAPTNDLRAAILSAALAYTIEKQKIDEAETSRKAYEESLKRQADARAQELAAGAAAVDRARVEVETYGYGAAAVTRYTIAKLQAKQATLEANEGTAEEIAAVQALIRQQQELIGLQNQKDDLDTMFDTAKVESFGQALREAFGEAGNAMAGLTNALQDYLDKQDEYGKQRTKISQKYAGDEKRQAKELAKLDDKQEKDRIGAYANMAGAAKGFFKQHTAGYKALEAVERGFRMFEMMMTAQSLAQKLFATNAVTAASVAGNAAQATSAVSSAGVEVGAKMAVAQANAAAAVSNQGNGDPYTAFPRIAAMIAIMAAIGLAVGGGGGGAVNTDLSADRQRKQGTGTVLGAEDEKSKSIANAIELLSENSNIALEHSSGMLSALLRIRDGIAGMAKFIAQTSGLRATAADELKYGVGQTRGGGLLGSGLFSSKTTTEIADSGVLFEAGQNVGSIIAAGVKAQGYVDIATTKKKWYGSSKTSRSTEYEALPERLLEQFKLTIVDMSNGIKTAAVSLGRSAPEVDALLGGIALGIDRISLKGKSGTEAVEELEAIFSAAGDTMVQTIMPSVKDFNQVGEGLLETLVRVANGVEVAQYELDAFGMTAINYGDILNKNGDVGAEIIRQTVLNAETLNGALTGVGAIMTTLDGTAEELASTYADLLAVQESLGLVGIDPESLGRSMVRGGRDLGKLQSGLDAYFDNYFTDAEKLAAKTEQMRGKFAALGREMPTSIEGFRALEQSIPKTTAEGQMLTGQLMLLADGFAELFETSNATEIANQKRKLEIELMREQGNAAGALAAERALELAEMDASLHALQKQVWAIQDAKQHAEDMYDLVQRSVDAERKAKEAAYKIEAERAQKAIKVQQDALAQTQNLSKALHSTLDRMKAPGMAGADRMLAKSQVAGALAIARAGGPLPSADSLQNALSTLSQFDEATYASLEEHQRDFYETAVLIADLAELTDAAVSVEERTLKQLQDDAAARELAHQQDMQRLDRILESARTQIDVMNGIRGDITSVAAAISALASATSAARALGAGTSGATAGSSLPHAGSLNVGTGGNAYNHRSGVNVAAGDSALITAAKVMYQSMTGGVSTAQYNAAMAAVGGAGALQGVGDPAAMRRIYGFADGGHHAGGWRVVGERGPELAYTGPEHILRNESSRALMDMSGLERRLDDFIDFAEPALFKIASNTGDVADTLGKFDRVGMPAEREEETTA